MNEFVVWEKTQKKFLTHKDMQLFGLLIKFSGLGNNHNVEMGRDEVSIHNFIGLKDINDNKIYADSSIVLAKINNKKEYYFKVVFSNSRMAYVLKMLDNSIIFPFYNNAIEILEVVDTIQENKLGLIK